MGRDIMKEIVYKINHNISLTPFEGECLLGEIKRLNELYEQTKSELFQLQREAWNQ